MDLKPVLLDILVRSAVIYGFLIILLRAGGKRHIGQMTPVDLVLLLLISNAVQNAMTGPDTSLMGGIVAASTLIGFNLLLSKISYRSKPFRTWLEGSPTILINHGEVLHQHLAHENINEEELLQALRAHGASVIRDVRLAVLEKDGSISVIRNEDIESDHTTKPYHRIKSLKRN